MTKRTLYLLVYIALCAIMIVQIFRAERVIEREPPLRAASTTKVDALDATGIITAHKTVQLDNSAGVTVVSPTADSYGDGDPTGTVTAARGSMILDGTNAFIYQNTDGATNWQRMFGPNAFPNSYTGRSFSYTDEWLQGYAALSSNGGALGSIYQGSFSGTGANCIGVASTQRPGIYECSTSTTTTGAAGFSTSPQAIDQGAFQTISYRGVLGVPVLSTLTDTYRVLVGFQDSAPTVGVTDGCFWLYDQGNAQPGNINPTNLNQWEAWCCSGGVCTGVLTTCPVAALTLPNTNIYDLILSETAGTVTFTSNGTVCTTINTNVPSGSIHVTGAGVLIRKSAGTTSRVFDVDLTTLSFTYATPRSS